MAAPERSAPADLRSLPSVDAVLRHPGVAALAADHGRADLRNVVREELDQRRRLLQAGEPASTELAKISEAVRARLDQRNIPHLRRVINATGIVLHTGLGRAPLAAEAIQAIADVAAGYCNLELNLESGERGDRHEHVRELLRELTGAEDGLVVNNCAAATYLTLNSLAAGRGVIVSRGQLVEIGGSYRMPDIMAAAGCRMVEVGTTNRTRLSDYERAIQGYDGGDQPFARLDVAAAVLLRVHQSNYRIEGFVESVPLRDLAALAERFIAHRLLVVDDLGSGLLDAIGDPGSDPGTALGRDGRNSEVSLHAAATAGRISDSEAPSFQASFEDSASRTPPSGCDWDEPSVRQSIADGAHLTLFSGDKLLGGPQAGIAVGRSDLIARLRKNPLMRALRPDKLTLAALEATLRLYRDPGRARQRIPVLSLLLREPAQLERTARDLAGQLQSGIPAADIQAEPDHSYAGGGSLPTLPFPTWIVRVRLPGTDAGELAAALRQADPPVVCRVQKGAVVLDCRALQREDLPPIAAALRAHVARDH